MTDVTRTEMQLIAQDTAELIQLVLNNKDHPAFGTISLGLVPFVGLVAEESFNYLTAPSRASFGITHVHPLFETFAANVTKVRARAKLFDDNRGGLAGLIENLALAHRKSSEWFMHPHRGLLGILARPLQPDLGIFYFEDHVIVTTHTALLTLGITQDQLTALGPADMSNVSRFYNEFSLAVGSYLGTHATHLQESGYNVAATFSVAPAKTELSISHTDHHGHLVYTHVSDTLGLTRPELSAAIIFLVAQVNFVERVLSQLLAPTSTVLFWARFLTAYHATTALQELVGLEPAQLGRLAQDILNEPDAGFLLGARQIRNISAHYELRGAARFLSPAGDPFDDVLVGLCGQDRADVMAKAQRQLSRISAAFEDVISKPVLRGTRALLGDHT
jgi:hypothetical protein